MYNLMYALKTSFDMGDLMSSVKLMWQGMAAIFIVMALIAVIVYLFTKFIKK